MACTNNTGLDIILCYKIFTKLINVHRHAYNFSLGFYVLKRYSWAHNAAWKIKMHESRMNLSYESGAFNDLFEPVYKTDSKYENMQKIC